MKNKKENKLKIKELKEKEKEQTRLIELNSSSTKAREYKLANKTPKGERNISNTQNSIIDVIKINKYYATGKSYTHVLKDISLNIKKGEFVVILGPSGSGKTTLLNILSGLDRPTYGDVVVNNINISSLSNSELTTFRRHNVGFVFQSYNLLSELNAMDNALMGSQLQIDGNKRLDVKELFEKVGLEGSEKKAIGELSGGQAQRVSIVRALAKNPEVIFADEPTGALDSKTSEKVLDLFKDINKKYNTTIVFVTHDEKIAKLADKLIRVEDGKVTIEKRT